MTAVASDVLARVEARARRDPQFAQVLETIVDASGSGAGRYSRVAARELSRQRRTDAVETFKQGALPTAEVQRLLRLGTPQAVHRLRSRGRLLGAQLGNATWFPAWQFVDGRLRPDLPRILELLGRFTADAIAADRIMRLVRDDLGGSSVAAALDRPKWAPAAWAVLTELGS